jgi:hypothetical protein
MKKYIQKENCEATELDEECLILDTNNYTVTKLNSIGGFCWNLLREPQSAEDLITVLKDTYWDFKDEEDIECFIDELLEYGLITNAR